MTPFGEFSQVCRTWGPAPLFAPPAISRTLPRSVAKRPSRNKTNSTRASDEGQHFRLYPQDVPATPAIDRSTCIQSLTGDCGACERPVRRSHRLQQQDVRETLNVGAVILSPGFQVFNPAKYETYNYSRHPNVVTAIEFERILSASGPFGGHLVRPSDHTEPKKIAWLQCVGSRDVKTHSYCSSVCCMYAIKEAVIAKEHAPYPLGNRHLFHGHADLRQGL